MAKIKPTQVRLSESVDTRLGEIADYHDMTKSALIRMCVDAFLDEIERTGKISITQVIEEPPGSYKSKKANAKTA